MQNVSRTPVMIADAAFAGSLAAVRVLGRAGISVVVGDRHVLDVARWSRYAGSRCELRTDRGQAPFLSDMAKVARRSQKHVLLATSDMTAWLYARHRDRLSAKFNVYVPTFSVVDTIVDKGRLWSVCQRVGIPTIESWFPEDIHDVASLEDKLRYPLVVKPRSHVHSEFFTKGTVVHNSQELAAHFARFVERASISLDGGTCLNRAAPMLQTFVETAVDNVMSVSGFIDRSGKHSVVRASRKVLQRSRPIGLGLAFESTSVDPALAAAVLGLCREIGYFGIFEIEFIQQAGVWCLIDFNPRFYQEMALDIAGGALLPLYAYLDACGDEAGLETAIARSGAPPDTKLRFVDTIGLVLRVVAKPRTEKRALAWLISKRGRLVDAAFDLKDPLPAVAWALAEARSVIRRLASLPAFRVSQVRRAPRSVPTAKTATER